MSRPTSLRHRAAVTLAVVALVLWVVFIGLFIQYAGTRPHTPQPEIGRIYQINNHGTVAYLDRSERNRLSVAQWSAGALFIVAATLSRWPRKST